MNWDMIASFLSAISIMIAVYTYVDGVRRKKTADTLAEIDNILEAYYSLSGTDVSRNYKELVSYMSKVERFATSVNAGLYNKKIVEDRASIFLKEQYRRFMEEIITQRRKQFKREDYYHNIEKLVNSFSVTKKEDTKSR